MTGSEPTSTANAPFWSGGYYLQYMYTITSSEVNKFLTTDFIPVSTDSTVSAAGTDGAIDDVITTAGSGYTDGTYYCPVFGDGTSQGTSSGAIVKLIVTSGSIVAFGETDGTNTTMYAVGAGYTYGTVNLTTDVYTDTSLSSAANTTGTIGGGSSGAVTVQISPKGGHGYNAVKELGGHYVMMNTTLTEAEGDDVSTANDFRRVGIIKNPYAYGTTSGSTYASASTARMTKVMKLASVSGTFTVDEKISQATTAAIGKVIEWDSSLSLLYYQQERFGDYGTDGTGAGTGSFVAFSGENVVTGASSSATGTPDADADSAITLANSNTLTPTDGYANEELQKDYGDILYVENRKPISRASDQTEDIKIIVEF
jgi:hypothetical protein